MTTKISKDMDADKLSLYATTTTT